MKVSAASIRLRALCGALLALSLLSACSYTTDFVIVNDSDSPIRISYSFKNWREPDDCCPEPPAKKAADKLDDGDVTWADLRAEEFHFDRVNGVVTVMLGPSEALRVERENGFGGHGRRTGDDFFGVASVHITGASGEVYYEGQQAQYQFQRVDSVLYKLTYYGWGDKSHDGGR